MPRPRDDRPESTSAPDPTRRPPDTLETTPPRSGPVFQGPPGPSGIPEPSLRPSEGIGSSITLVLLNHRRPDNLMHILDAAAAQSSPPVLFVWNNDPHTPLVDERIDWIVNSSKNQRCWPRWFMASFAETEFVAVMDDDICFRDLGFLEELSSYLMARGGRDAIIGPEGVRLGESPGYYPAHAGPVEVRAIPEGSRGPVHFARPHADERVDIVKGRFMALHRDAVLGLPEAPEFRDVCDDIAVSAYAGSGRRQPHLVPAWLGDRFVDLPDKEGPMALSTQPWFKPRREEATSYYFFSPVEKRR